MAARSPVVARVVTGLVPVLLLAALVMLVLGLMQSTSRWLLGSLVASVLAAGLLVFDRLRPRRPPGATTGAAPLGPREAPAALAPVTPDEPAMAVTAAVPAPAPGPVPAPQAVPVAPATAPARTPAAATDVWVVDGRPRYHRQTCEIIATQDAEPVDYDQAVEDGFVPCSLCAPAAD